MPKGMVSFTPLVGWTNFCSFKCDSESCRILAALVIVRDVDGIADVRDIPEDTSISRLMRSCSHIAFVANNVSDKALRSTHARAMVASLHANWFVPKKGKVGRTVSWRVGYQIFGLLNIVNHSRLIFPPLKVVLGYRHLKIIIII